MIFERDCIEQWQEFDRGIFESIIEKVIVGGYDEDGNKDPYKINMQVSLCGYIMVLIIRLYS